MKAACLVLICISTLLPDAFINAQSTPTEDTCTNVAFGLSVGTNISEINAGVFLTATITNRSDVPIGVTDRDRTFLSITGSIGQAYHFSLMRSDYKSLMFHSRSMAIEPSSVYEWPLSFGPNDEIHGKKVVPGTYVLQATCEIFTGTNEIHSLTSDPVNIIIQ